MQPAAWFFATGCNIIPGMNPVILSLSMLLCTTAAEPGKDPESFERFARLALDCLHREYPNKLAHVLQGDRDAKPPRELTPVFFGCYDWHSAVHGHWLLVRLCRMKPDASYVAEARAALHKSFNREAVEREVRYLRGKGRRSFERPYGLAWLLQLDAELAEWKDPQARQWKQALAPLAAEVAARFKSWLPKLSHPSRTGEHSQSAFALALVLDWARKTGDREMEALVTRRALDYYGKDKGWSFSFEPGGQDFLSPGLAEADLMRRVLGPRPYALWLAEFLPGLPSDVSTAWLKPAEVTDRSDGKLAHLDGLNLSRAWALEGMLRGLPAGDRRIPALRKAALDHRKAGLAAVTGEHYEGGHWLGSFAVYLVTGRGY